MSQLMCLVNNLKNDFYLSSEMKFTCGESVITPDEKSGQW